MTEGFPIRGPFKGPRIILERGLLVNPGMARPFAPLAVFAAPAPEW